MSLLIAALLAGAAPAVAEAPADKVRCKREVETGSLVKARKVCRTEAEWEAVRRDARETRDKLQGPGFSSPATGGPAGGG